MTSKTHTVDIDHLMDGQLWVEALLELFFDVDEVVKDRPEAVDATIMASYQRAEAARKRLS